MMRLYVALGLGLAVVGIGVPSLAASDAAANGAKVYAENCAQCHGANMVDPGSSAFDLRTFPADQHDRFINSVTNGKAAMPAWAGIVTPAQMEELWAYVLTAKAGSGAASKK